MLLEKLKTNKLMIFTNQPIFKLLNNIHKTPLMKEKLKNYCLDL